MKFNKILTTALILGVTSFVTPQVATAGVVYNNDFESGSTTGFSGSLAVEGTQGYSADGFGQQFLRTASSFTLSLTGLATHTTVSMDFLFAAIDSWDGAGSGNDALDVRLDGVSILNLVVGNASGTTTNPLPTGVSAIGSLSNRGFASWADRAFDIGLADFAHSASTLTLDFIFGGSPQGASDESLAIDNLVITTNANMAPVPLPAGLPLLVGALGVLGVAGRRRKKVRQA